ncbi:50S ribosomal protein L31 [Xenorhabdus sp. Vera]|nr:hypothetical protein [Xenorhabdus sp. Vera]MBD2809713.1 50S ribosomal protein L31 [Xenorhabdus sp. Vera]
MKQGIHPFYMDKQRSVSQEGSTARFQKGLAAFLIVNNEGYH